MWWNLNDVIVTDNMFGDIITDLGAMIQSRTGNAPAQKSFGSQYFGGANQWYINNLEDLIRCQ